MRKIYYLSTCSTCARIIAELDLKNKKFLLLEDTDVYLYEKSEFLYHIFNVSEIMHRYESLEYATFRRTHQDVINENRILTLMEQLNEHAKNKRSLDFLGNIIKWIAGTPDNDDLIEIKQHLNEIIDNNNQQRVINSQFDQILNRLDPSAISKSLIIQETLRELEILFDTIISAKTGNFLSKSLNLNDVKKIINHLKIQIPILNVMEYSNIHVGRINKTFIIIYKYPLVTQKCILYNIVPLSYMHGNLRLDTFIAKCNNNFVRVKDCKTFIGTSICKIEKPDECNTNLIINNITGGCNTIAENNEPIQTFSFGNIILDGTHVINKNTTVNGIKHIQFNDSIIIDNQTYYNIENKIQEYIHQEANVHIDNVVESLSEYKFNNIKQLHKLIIPIEEHPFLTICYVITTAVILYYTYRLMTKYIQLRQAKKANKRISAFTAIYRQRPLDENEDVLV